MKLVLLAIALVTAGAQAQAKAINYTRDIRVFKCALNDESGDSHFTYSNEDGERVLHVQTYGGLITDRLKTYSVGKIMFEDDLYTMTLVDNSGEEIGTATIDLDDQNIFGSTRGSLQIPGDRINQGAHGCVVE